MAEKATIARPYARAAFAHARAASALARWSDALNAAAAVVAHPQAKKLIGNPNISSNALLDFISEVAAGAGAKFDSDVRNFLEELSRNGRLGLLPEVAAMFQAMSNEAENVADVHVTSAVALTDAQRQRLTEALKKRLKKREVRLQCDVDPALLGGALIRAGDWVLDGSLRARLQNLANAITA